MPLLLETAIPQDIAATLIGMDLHWVTDPFPSRAIVEPIELHMVGEPADERIGARRQLFGGQGGEEHVRNHNP
jgi:hypothetical protein